MKNPKISILVLTINRKEFLKRALNSVRNQTFKDYEIIVVDNGSTDGTPEMIKKNFPEVKLIEMKSNTGCVGRNKGSEVAKGEILFSLDDDGYLEKNALKNTIKHFEEDPKLGVACFKVLDPEKKEISNWPHNMPKEKYKDKEFYTTCFGAGAHALRAKILKKMPYFYNKDFFIYGEEFETSYKILNLGYDFKYFPDIIMYHKLNMVYKMSPKRYYFERRNMLWTYWINFPFFYAIKRTLSFIIKDSLRVPKELWKAHLKYIMDAFLSFPKIITKYRKPIKKEILKKIIRINKLGYY
jgi:hypothetical protein